ncbi:histidine--tRNA ligase [Patescibacteria group bacterium]|nr:histidine--tRNA ligase [Patescibacteria group bacterium]
MPETPQTLKGFRDFLPAEKRKREYVAQKMRNVFERHGFAPLETPTLEYASLLLGKYGDEADKLVYTFEDRGERQVGLRYDQTVPTARVLSQYQHELPRYFRRYQIQNVFRADKPQKGRYREFTQCDCDVFGSLSPLADAEILSVYYDVFKEIGLDSIVIELNDRQTLLQTLQVYSTDAVSVFSIIQSVDKLDKMSASDVVVELVSKGLKQDSAQSVITAIETATPSSNLQAVIDAAVQLGVPRSNLVFNPRIARGLDYYTGMIFEGRIPEYTVGSVGGGGRYDNLIQDLSGFEMPAVGFGIGFDRTVEAADQLGLIPTEGQGTRVLIAIMNETDSSGSLEVAQKLRQANISTEVYPAIDKLAKQFKLADQKKIPFVVVIGEEERANNKVTLKNLATGQQQLLSLDECITQLGS